VLLHGLGGERSDIRPGLRLGEVHGGAPLAADHVRQVGGLEFVAAVVEHGVDRTVRQHRRQRPGHARSGEQLAHGEPHGLREAAAAELLGEVERGPSTVHIGAIGVSESGRRGHARVARVVLRPDLIAHPVERRDHAVGEVARLADELLDRLEVGVRELGVGRDGVVVCDILHGGEDLLGRGGVTVHVLTIVTLGCIGDRPAPSCKQE
jgi:hypothetical protein